MLCGLTDEYEFKFVDFVIVEEVIERESEAGLKGC